MSLSGSYREDARSYRAEASAHEGNASSARSMAGVFGYAGLIAAVYGLYNVAELSLRDGTLNLEDLHNFLTLDGAFFVGGVAALVLAQMTSSAARIHSGEASVNRQRANTSRQRAREARDLGA